MGKNDELWALIFGGIIGAALAAPKQIDKEELTEYRNLKDEISLRKNKIGELPSLEKLRRKPEYYGAFVESYKMYLQGFFRGATLVSSALIEAILKDRFGADNFYNLIESAKGHGLITESEYHFMHGVRIERNFSAHDILKEVIEEDAIIILRLVIKIMNKLL